MKKYVILSTILVCALFAALNYRGLRAPIESQESSAPSALHADHDPTSDPHQNANSSLGSISSAEIPSDHSDPSSTKVREVSGQVTGVNALTDASAPNSSMRKTEPSPGPSLSGIKVDDDGGPSIGTVKVLGHRGCDANTQGWFLSVGNPEQYDFTVSDDGETVMVTPNVPQPTGNFEFVHCVDMGQVMEKRVRMTAQIKAEGVMQTANLRLRGEDLYRKKVMGGETQVGGTHDWKEYSVDGTIGRDVALFSYGLTFKSVGKLWISHPTLMTVPSETR